MENPFKDMQLHEESNRRSYIVMQYDNIRDSLTNCREGNEIKAHHVNLHLRKFPLSLIQEVLQQKVKGYKESTAGNVKS